MTRKTLVLLAAGGSAALLIGAFIFQALGYLPCQMCLWQRWPHGGAILAGGLAVLTGARLFIALGGLSALTTGAIGAYHAGVEQHWWPGPSSCGVWPPRLNHASASVGPSPATIMLMAIAATT